MRYVRVLEIVLGVVFVYSAVGKALDIPQFAQQVQYYGVVTDPSAVKILAYFMIVLETAFAACLLGGFRFGGFTYLATTGLLLGFSGLVIYAWSYRGLEDCGCFGVLMQMGPKGTLAKNAVLIGLVAGAWVGTRRNMKAETTDKSSVWTHKRTGYLLSVAGTAVVLIAAAQSENFSPPAVDPSNQTSDGPFGKYVFTTEMSENIDLGSGEYFVVMLSADCEHCQAASEMLNQLMFEPGMPTTVGLLMGDEEKVADFNATVQPMFITHVIDSLEWGALIGKEPPRFYVTRDGHAIRHLDALEPTVEELHAFVVQPAEETSSPQESEMAS
jgi:uncharacterized membrane protein YphA (DoxX/SURF4 family)